MLDLDISVHSGEKKKMDNMSDATARRGQWWRESRGPGRRETDQRDSKEEGINIHKSSSYPYSGAEGYKNGIKNVSTWAWRNGSAGKRP